MGALRLHRCPILIMDEADQLLGDVYAADMAHIVEHCGKKLGQHKAPAAAQRGKAPAAAAAAGDVVESSSSSSSSGDEGSLLLPVKRQTVLVSATLWAGVLGRFAKWCPEPQFLTMGNAPTWSNDDSDADAANDKGSEGSKT
jgi:superfamily II DNA/RNA helicase